MFSKIVTSACILLVAAATSAAPIQQSQTIAPTNTNFSTTVSFNQFDDMGGTLTLDSVTIMVDGVISGDIEVESLDATASTITTTLDAMMSLSTAGLGELVGVTLPTVTNNFSAGAFDGTTDFMGTSGVTYLDLGGNVLSNETYYDAATLALFTGSGTKDFTFSALATSLATGPGNLFSQFNVVAGGTITITYDSIATVNVNTPTGLALVGFGLLAIFGNRRFKH